MNLQPLLTYNALVGLLLLEPLHEAVLVKLVMTSATFHPRL